MFGDIEFEKSKFYLHKNPVPLRDVHTEKVLLSKKISFEKKKKTKSTLLVTCIMIIKLTIPCNAA